MKCLNSSGMVSLPYVILESPHSVLSVCVMFWIVSSMLIFGRGIPRRCKDKLASEWKILLQTFLGHCKLGRKAVGDIIGNQIPDWGWFHDPWHCAVVCCIFLEQFVHHIWLLSLLLFWYICKYGFIQIQVGQRFQGGYHRPWWVWPRINSIQTPQC